MTRAIRRVAIAAVLMFGCASSDPGGRTADGAVCKIGAPCDDGDLSTANDVCREGGGCVGVPIVCPSHDCIQQATPNGVDCDVTYRPDGAACDDESVCTEDDRCHDGDCRGGTPVVCDDGDGCTEDACDPALGCTSAWVGGVDCVFDCTIEGTAVGHTLKREPSHTTDVALNGDVAIVGSQSGVELYDVSVPHRPGLLGALPLAGGVLALEARADVVYVALGGGDVVALDVSQPASPSVLGVLETAGEVHGLHLKGTTAYLADDDQGLVIYDVSDPSVPVLEGALLLPGWALDVHVKGDIAFIANRVGMIVVDVTKPALSKQVAFLNTPGYALGVQVVGLTAYVSYRSGLAAIDVTAPTQPVLRSRHETPGYVYEILVQGGIGYVADFTEGLTTLDVSDSSEFTALGSLVTPGYATHVALDGTTAYLAASEGGLRIIDVSEPASPIELGAIDDRAHSQSIHLRGDLAYLSDGLGGLLTFDVSDPSAPTQLGRLDTPYGGTWGFHLVGTTAYLAQGMEGFAIADLSDPSAPFQIASLAFPGHSQDVQVVGPVVYVAAGLGGLRVVDVSLMDSPVELAALDGIGPVKGLHVFEQTAYLAAGKEGLRVVDVTKTAAPVELLVIDKVADATDVLVVGGTLFVADGVGALHLFDLSDPTHPVALGWHKTPAGAQHLQLVGDILYVTCGSEGLVAYDVIDPETIRQVLQAKTSGQAMAAQVRGNTAFVADGSFALTVLNLEPPCPGDDSACGSSVCDVALGCISVSGDSVCDDGIGCTVDICEPGVGCVHAPGAGDCDDGLACTVDTCTLLGGCGHATFDAVCDDEDACTTDACSSSEGCVHVTIACDDGLFCNGPESCHWKRGCESVDPPVVTDANPCTADSCVEATETIIHVPNDAACDDGSVCTVDACDLEAGCSHALIDCEDDDPCTTSSCHPKTGCQINQFPCDDGLFCNGEESCDGLGGCLPGVPPELDDGVACTKDVCHEGIDQVGHSLIHAECDDGDACTTDVCHLTDGCLHEPVECDDGNFCNGVETCDPAIGCVTDQVPVLSDGVLCTVDVCDEVADMVTHTPKDQACDDGNHCTTDICSPTHGCKNPWVGGFGCGYNCSVATTRLGATLPHGRSVLDEVVVEDGYLYAASSFGLEVYDISDPSFPVPDGSLSMPAKALDAAGHIVFVGTLSGALRVVDAVVPHKPAQMASLKGLGAVHAVEVVDDVLYLGTASGLKLIDVVDPRHPAIIATLALDGAARDLEVIGERVYVAADDMGLVVVDVSVPEVTEEDPEPEYPVQVSQTSLPGTARQISVSGDLAFVATDDAGLHVVDVSVPESPVVVLASHDPGGSQAVTVVGATVYTTATSEPTLVVTDFSDPTSPSTLSSGDLQADAFEDATGRHVVVSGAHAYVAAGRAGLHIFNVATSTLITKVGVFDDLGQAQGVRVNDNLAYIADGPGGFRVFDVTYPDEPLEIWHHDPLGAPYRDVELVDGQVFLVTTDALYVREADPNLDFFPLAQTPLTDGRAVQVVEGLATEAVALVADGVGGLRLFDVGPPALTAGAITELASLETEDARDVEVAYGTAFIADAWGGLSLVDVRDATAPVWRASLDLEDEVNGVHVVGPIAYVTGATLGLHIVDVRDLDAPALIATRSLSGTITGVQVVGTSASVTVGQGGLSFVNTSDLESPVYVGGVHLQTYDDSLVYGAAPVGEVLRHDGLASVASGDLALTTLSVTPPCDDGDPCTADVCDDVFGCSHPPDEATCYDGDPCTADVCSAEEGCLYPADPGVLCDDEDPTTRYDACGDDGVCVGTPYTCTPTQCELTSTPNGVGCDVTMQEAGHPCEDGSLSTMSDVCDGSGSCGGTPYWCATTDVCEASSTPNGVDCQVVYHDGSQACDDGDPTTHFDACDGAGGCAGTPYACVPFQCEVTSTHNGVDCDVTYQDAVHPCDDGDPTTAEDTCNGIGTCQGTPYDCDVSPCVTSSVHNGVDCDVTFAPAQTPCDDLDPGTDPDACDGLGACIGVSLCPPQELVFTVSGAVHEVSVPDCATAVTLEVWGAGGGYVDEPNDAGRGGWVRGTMSGLSGRTLYVSVGGAGSYSGDFAVGGYNGGGGSSQPFTVGGGGATDVRLDGDELTDRIIVAGGGGGAAWCSGEAAYGGHGGGLIGEAGGHIPAFDGAEGWGGLQTAGGAGGGFSGTLGVGGDALTLLEEGCAGAGGGGYYGGGGATDGGGGGGGSSWHHPSMTDAWMQVGVQPGSGKVVISW